MYIFEKRKKSDFDELPTEQTHTHTQLSLKIEVNALIEG